MSGGAGASTRAGGRILAGQHERQHQVGDDADPGQPGDDEGDAHEGDVEPRGDRQAAAHAGEDVVAAPHEPPLGAPAGAAAAAGCRRPAPVELLGGGDAGCVHGAIVDRPAPARTSGMTLVRP